MKLLHFTGQVWRPPYESSSQLLQVTAGCTHNKCKFCSLYHGTKFRLSPITEVEEDLKVIQSYQPKARRVFLTGANPFVLSYNRLLDLGLLIRKYLRHCESIGMFARISDIKPKTVEELKNLRHLGFDGISIGTESGDDNTLAAMNKGYTANDIIEQCKKLEDANIRYNLVYLTGLAGKGKGERNAINTANVFNQLHPLYCKLCITDRISRIRIIRGNTTWFFCRSYRTRKVVGTMDFYFKTSYKNNFIRKYGIKHCPVCRNDT